MVFLVLIVIDCQILIYHFRKTYDWFCVERSLKIILLFLFGKKSNLIPVLGSDFLDSYDHQPSYFDLDFLEILT